MFLGDPRRPYPLDIEMRCGALGQLSQKGAVEAGLPVDGGPPTLDSADPLTLGDDLDPKKEG